MASREGRRRRSSQEEAERRQSRHDRHRDPSVEDRKQSSNQRRSPLPRAIQPPPPRRREQEQEQQGALPLPPPPDYPPPPPLPHRAHNRNDRKRGWNSRSSSPSVRSGSIRRPNRHRGSRGRHRDDHEGHHSTVRHGSGEEGRNRRRPRQKRRRQSQSSSPNKPGRSASPRGRGPGNRNEENNGGGRRRGGRRPPENHSDNSTISSSLDSRNRRGRRRKRRRRPSRRRHGSRRSTPSPRSQPRRGVPVANDVGPRAGVVSDDDEQARLQQATAASGRGLPPPPQRHSSRQRERAPGAAKKRSSHSSSHDDTIGHFKGKEGTVIADRYRIEREVGVGTFGRVVECTDLKRFSRSGRRAGQSSVVAIKIVRNVKRYYESALIEADIVDDVNRRGGRGLTHCAVMYDAFSFSGHYCMVFEKLGPSLYDFQKRQKYRPFPLMCVRDFAKQLLETLEFLHSFGLIHTDLKPENILLLNGREVNYKGRCIPECTRIKVIDFGGATYDNEKKSSVVNTRQYRAPEVILGVGWSTPSDLWSIGCILAELYQGELLFATHDNVEHLALIEQVVGPFPRRMLKRAKNTHLVSDAFDSMGAHRMERKLPPESLAYVKRIGSLESLTHGADTWFLRLLRRILVTDPDERATARECLRKL